MNSNVESRCCEGDRLSVFKTETVKQVELIKEVNEALGVLEEKLSVVLEEDVPTPVDDELAKNIPKSTELGKFFNIMSCSLNGVIGRVRSITSRAVL